MKIRRGLFGLLVVSIGANASESVPPLISRDNPSMLARVVPQPLIEKKFIGQISTPAATPSLALDTTITVQQVQIIGGTRYSIDELAPVFQIFIGRKTSLRVLLAATNSITERYHRDGYPISFAYLPVDNFQQGIVKVVLVEGHVSGKQIDTKNPNVAARIERLSEKIIADKPLTSAVFERNTILMNRTPGIQVMTSIDVPTNVNGQSLMKVKTDPIDPRHWNFGTAIDSRKGETLAILNAIARGFTSYGDQLGLATLIPLKSPNKDRFLGLNYQQFIGDDGWLMNFKGSYFKQKQKDYYFLTEVSDQEIDYREDQTQFITGINFSYPLILTQKKQWTAGIGMDYTDATYDYDFRLYRAGDEVDINIPSLQQKNRYPAAEGTIQGFYRYEQAYWTARVGIRQGINSWFAENKNTDSKIGFTRWKASGEAAYLVAKKWRFSTAIDGSLTNDILPQVEQINFGGLRFGRGYQSGEATGDSGFGGQIELRYLFSWPGRWLDTIQPYIVTDMARTYYNTSELRENRLSSFALGTSLGYSKYYLFSIEAAKPTGDLPSDTDRRSWRYNFTFTYQFDP